MTSVSITFLPTEKDWRDAYRHAYLHGHLKPLVVWLPLAIALFAFIWLVASRGWSFVGFSALLSAFLGVYLFVVSWYSAPRWGSALPLQEQFPDSGPARETTVRVSPESIAWSVADVSTDLPWGIVRSVDTLPAGISIRLGLPSMILWIPARALPTPEDLQQVGALAAEYAAQAGSLPPQEVQWPETKEARRQIVLFFVILGLPIALALLIALWRR